ncbi:MAG TPA: hypothetical protein VHP37_07845 [Burkholderiales bacterium]|nr:hypothetical protein [Burkholderiales bacterium]
MIVSFNFYYAQPAQADAVLRQRLLACDVRLDLKLPRGRVLARQSGSAELPDVVWEQHFDDVDGHLRDMDVRAASAAFEAVRAGMRKLCRRFERPLFEAQSPVATESGIVTLDWVYGSADVDVEVVELLQAAPADDVQALRLITPGDDLPRWLLKREGVEADSVDHRAWREAAAGIGDRAKHSVWRIV